MVPVLIPKLVAVAAAVILPILIPVFAVAPERAPIARPVPVAPVGESVVRAVELFEVTLTKSFAVAGDRVVPLLAQKPTVPEAAQTCPEIQTVPVASGRVQVRAAVRSTEVTLPVKELDPELKGTKAKASALATEEVRVRLPLFPKVKTFTPACEATNKFWSPPVV